MLPLAQRYKSSLKSPIADIVNSVEGPGGAIIAALYLQEFIEPTTNSLSNKQKSEHSKNKHTANNNDNGRSDTTWFHIDFMGLYKGMAEPQGLRAVFEYIKALI